MANWNNPIISSLYIDVLNDLKARDVDAITMNSTAGTNLPNGAMRFERGSSVFQEWVNNNAWQNKVLAVAGGGTGATGSAGAIANLGLGTMSTQNANGVAISGGNINTLAGFSVSCDIIPSSDNVRAIGSNAQRFHRIYLRSGCVLPVGVNMYVTG